LVGCWLRCIVVAGYVAPVTFRLLLHTFTVWLRWLRLVALIYVYVCAVGFCALPRLLVTGYAVATLCLHVVVGWFTRLRCYACCWLTGYVTVGCLTRWLLRTLLLPYIYGLPFG